MIEHWSIEKMLAFGKLLSEPQQEWSGIMPSQMVTMEDLHTRFTYHAPKEGQPDRYKGLRAHALSLAVLIINNTPASREQSLAITKLEEVIFWANAAIARNE